MENLYHNICGRECECLERPCKDCHLVHTGKCYGCTFEVFNKYYNDTPEEYQQLSLFNF